MTTFVNAMTDTRTRTTNGMGALTTTGSKVLDLFSKMGASRMMSEEQIVDAFSLAGGEDFLLTLKAMFYARDIRGGMGERRAFRVMFRRLCVNSPIVAIRTLPNVPFFGRWDDLFVAIGTPVEGAALGVYATALANGDKLAAKWAPREGKKNHDIADKLRKTLGLDWKAYRKLLAGNTSVVETKMCAKQWGAINYSHVPSQAAKNYRTAFFRNDEERYKAYVEALTSGNPNVKINAGAIHPHEIIAPLTAHVRTQNWMEGAHGVLAQNVLGNISTPLIEQQALEAQWKALPDYMPKGRKVLPVVDVSGSMSGLPMQVALALGLYVAERNAGPFKDAIITFSARPTFLHLDSTTLSLTQRVRRAMESPWGQNTDLEAVFKLILKKAMECNLPPEDMPETVIIVSDMQFDKATAQRNPQRYAYFDTRGNEPMNDTALDMISKGYDLAGYKRPNLVFWNVNGVAGNQPVKTTERGTALVSGFSPAILKAVFAGEDMNPVATMLNALNSPRYERVTL